MTLNLRNRISQNYYEPDQEEADERNYLTEDFNNQSNIFTRSLRQRKCISYYEPEEPSFDQYEFCEECADYVFEYCAIHGPLLVIPDDKVHPKPNFPPIVPRAALTIPHVFLHLAPSIIPGAGIGVFSTLTLPRGVRFGPYRGQRSYSVDSMYCWQIYDSNNKRSHVVDAADAQRSNWMRYVNCARHWTEQNLVAYQYQGQLYYRTIKVIPRFTELLVFYGSEFANMLNINLSKYNSSEYYEEIIYTQQESIQNQLEINESISNSLEENEINDTSNSPNNDELLNFDEHFQIIEDITEINDETTQITFLDENTVELNFPQTEKETGFQCDKCQKTFAKKKYLTKHILSHMEPKFKCDKCKYKTSIKYSFKRHLKGHASRKIFTCDKCSYKTDLKSEYAKHISEHNNSFINSASYYSKLKQCNLCEFSTFSKKSYQMHTIKHKGIEYKCEHCEYKTYYKIYYTSHVARMHGIKNK